MTVTISSTEDQHRPLYRILISATWGNASWAELPMAPRWDIGRFTHGFEMIEHDRRCLPDVGQASFLFHYGVINGRQYGTGGQPMDLTGYYVRIQSAEGPLQVQQVTIPGAARAATAGFSPQWSTCWIGRVEAHEDQFLPGASYPIGVRTYHCLEIIAVTKRWPLLKHGFAFPGGAAVCRGNPGYNRGLPDGTLQGNKSGSATVDPAGDSNLVPCRTYPGQGLLYTDQDVVNDALLCGRESSDPLFVLATDYGLLQSAQAWEITEQMRVFDLLVRILRRQRGRGSCFVTWASDLGSPLAPLTLSLTVNPQTANDITYTDPQTGGTVTMPGAASAGTVMALVDLVGDHRNVDATFRLGSRYQNKWDYVETVGDRIEVFVTLSYADGTLEERWTGSEQNSFTNDAPFTINNPASATKYEAVFQLHSPPRAWNLQAADGSGLFFPERIDIRCLDNGQLQFPSGANDTSPISIEVQRDTVLPSPGDSAIGVMRGEPLAFVAPNAGFDLWLDIRTEIGGNLAIRRDNAILLKHAGDENLATRYFGDKSSPAVGSIFNYTQLAFSVSIRLPHRIRFADGDANGSRRHPPIYVRDQCLWLLHVQAITHLDLSTGTPAAGHTPIRGDYGTPVPGEDWTIVRDNRSQLARVHALNWSWYGVERRTATWQLRAAGSLRSFQTASGATVSYPQLGMVVQQLSAGGSLITLNTPITRIHVQVQKHTATWETDWCDRDTE